MGVGGSGLRPQERIDLNEVFGRALVGDVGLGEIRALVEVVEAAHALSVEVPGGFDTGPGQDRVDAVFARLEQALSKFDFGGESVG